MKNKLNNLENIGFSDWIQTSIAPESLEQFDLARVIAVHKDSYIVSHGEVDVPAALVGKLIFSASSPADYPAVGDWVLVNFYDENTLVVGWAE